MKLGLKPAPMTIESIEGSMVKKSLVNIELISGVSYKNAIITHLQQNDADLWEDKVVDTDTHVTINLIYTHPAYLWFEFKDGDVFKEVNKVPLEYIQSITSATKRARGE